MSILRIYFPAHWQDSATPCPWALCDASGAVLEQGNAPLAALPKATAAVAIIAAQRLSCLEVPAPAQSRRRWEAALPFIAEEYTLTDPEENHVVPSAPGKEGTRTLYIVDKRWLHALISACHTAGIHLRQAIPEMLLPDLSENGWTMVWNGRDGFVRTAQQAGIAIDLPPVGQPPAALQLCLESSGHAAPSLLQVRYSGEMQNTALPDWPGFPVKLVRGEDWDWKRARLDPALPNLLWGEFAPRARLAEHFPKLRPALLILTLALLIEAAGTNLEWALLTAEKNRLNQEMARIFRQAFGESSNVVNPMLQMQRNLAALHHAAGLPDDSDFLPLLDSAAPSLAALPAGSVTGLHYESGRLDLDLRLAGTGELQALQRRLLSLGFAVQTTAPHPASNGIETRLSLQTGVAP